MTLVVDAAPLVALADQKDRRGPDVMSVLDAEPGRLVIAAPVTAEVDYLLGVRLGRPARLAFLEDLGRGRFEVVALEPDDYKSVLLLERRYPDLDLGLADCATVVVAERVGTKRVLTFDQRHFRVVTPLQGGSFEILPDDR